jgi:hypothetical protein
MLSSSIPGRQFAGKPSMPAVNKSQALILSGLPLHPEKVTGDRFVRFAADPSQSMPGCLKPDRRFWATMGVKDYQLPAHVNGDWDLVKDFDAEDNPDDPFATPSATTASKSHARSGKTINYQQIQPHFLDQLLKEYENHHADKALKKVRIYATFDPEPDNDGMRKGKIGKGNVNKKGHIPITGRDIEIWRKAILFNPKWS